MQRFDDLTEDHFTTSRCVRQSYRYVAPATAGTARFTVCWAATGCVLFFGCNPERSTKAPAGKDHAVWLVEAAEQAGLVFEHVHAMEQRYYIPEIMSGGVCVLDYDGDGLLDVYFVQGGHWDPSVSNRPGNMLFRNRGDGTFEDVTNSSGTGDAEYGMGCAVGDFNRDGRPDLYVTNLGPNVLYRNNGDGRFTDVTDEAGVGDAGWGASAVFADIDADGMLDLFIVNYLIWSPTRETDCRSELDQPDYCGPNVYQAPAADVLFRNRGDNTFEDISDSSGIGRALGNGLGVVAADFNGDGLADFFVANDGMPNHLWINAGDATFAERALVAGSALSGTGAPEAGMGIAAFDVDHDGRPDLFLSHLRSETNTLYRNRGEWFEDITTVMGLAAPSVPFTGFGLGFADFDHDGFQDLYIATGRVALIHPVEDPRKPYAEPNQLFAGRPGGRFEEVLPRGGTDPVLIETSRAAAFADLDNSGTIDIVVVNNGARAHLLHSVVGRRGSWVMFSLIDASGHDVNGAMVCIRSGGQRQCRYAHRAYSYCASSDPRVHFGLGASSLVDEVWVRWPGGTEETFGTFPSAAVQTLREGSGLTRVNRVAKP